MNIDIKKEQGMKAAVVGPGRAGSEHIKAYLACGMEVTAICGRTKESAEQKISETGLKATVYDNFDQMLDKEKIDVISICSPSEFHAEQTIKAALKGIHIAIEKPVALRKEELIAMQKVIKQTGVKTIVGFILRWNELVQNIKNSYIRQLGKLIYTETDYWNGPSHEKTSRILSPDRKQISTFLSGGCHAVDMARFLVDSDIISVSALTPFFEENRTQRTTTALVTFASGLVGKISATTEVFLPYFFNITLLGENGGIIFDKFYSKDSRHSADKKGLRPTLEMFETIPGQVPDNGTVTHHPFKNMIIEFVDCIRENREPSCNFENSINTHLTCFAAEESAKRGGEKIML